MGFVATLLLISFSNKLFFNSQECSNIKSKDHGELCALVYSNAENYDIKNDLGSGLLRKTGHDHITYRVIASLALGSNATNLEMQYEFESKGLDSALKSVGFITMDNWKQHLGDHITNTSIHYADYLDFFRRQMAERGMNAIIEMAWPVLEDGVTGDSFHALIQLSYAWEGKDSKIRMEIIAEGLAWLSTSFCKYTPSLLNFGRAHPISDILSALSDDDSIPFFNSTFSLADRMVALIPHAETLASYDIDGFSSTTYEIAVAVLRIFASTNYSDFFVLHLLTSSRAIDTLSFSLGSESMKTARKRHWRALVYWFCAYNRPRLPKLPLKQRKLPSWNELSQRCIGIFPGDSHLVKLVYLARDFASRFPDDSAIWWDMAFQIVEDFENGQGWSGTEIFTAPIESVVCATKSTD